MSLVGNLEDLGLGDILQIVSLSRKSGVLSLRHREREGRIVFRHGQVIQAASSVFRETLGELLLQRGLVDLDTLKRALRLQQQMPRPVRLGTILSERFGVARETIDSLLREHVEMIVYSLFGWTEGTFTFELGEPEELAATQLDPLQFMLDQGLSPQWLAMEGSRLLDERRRQGDFTEENAAPPEPFDDLPRGEETAPPMRAKPVPPGETTPPREGGLFDLGAELFQELGETPEATGPPVAATSPGLHLLKGMLQELNNPSLGGGIILLVLRFASEFMNRAVVFVVKDGEIAGLGQFGIELPGGQADARVRGMRIPAAENSPFSAVLHGAVPVKTRLGDGRWDAYLQEALGGGEPEEVFLGPLVSEGKTVAVLYGDNLPQRRPIGDTEPLEIFLSQAGIAMEKALLERRLQGRNVTMGGERDACGKRS